MRFLLCYCINRKQNNEYLQGRVKFPIGGKVRERFGAGFGATPKPTVTVWMEEDVLMLCKGQPVSALFHASKTINT